MTKRARRHHLTLNNPTEEEWNSVEELPPDHLVRATFVNEVGAEGTPHIQGYVHLVNGKTMSALKTWLGSQRWHIEVCKGTDYENRNYCLKETMKDSLGDGDACTPTPRIVEYGDEPTEELKGGPWDNILEMVENGESLLDICKEHPAIAIRCQSAISKLIAQVEMAEARWRDVKVSYIWGPTASGKTSSVYSEHGYTDVYRTTNKSNPWDMYEGQDVVVFEEFRNSYDISDMLNWLDGHPITLPARYADRIAKFTRVYICSNWELDEQYHLLQDRSPETWQALIRRIDEIVEFPLPVKGNCTLSAAL